MLRGHRICMLNRTMHSYRSTSGFSLIQISIILTVAAIILASTLPGGGKGDVNQRTLSTIAKLDAIEQATNDFMVKNGRRPCPASGGYDINARYFGVEAANAGTCTGATPAVQLGPDIGTGFIIAGTVPTKTLGMTDDFAFDEWGRPFTYTVDRRATSKTSCYVLQSSRSTGGITIKTTGAGSTIDNTMVAYISHGKDAHGAFLAQGSTPANRSNRGITDADTLINAGVDSSFVYNTTNFTNVRIKKDPTATFDDVVYYQKNTMNSCCAGAGCAPSTKGFTILGGVNANNTGISSVFGDINGDGLDDLIVGAIYSNDASYVVFGTKNYLTGNFQIANLNTTANFNGINITGEHDGGDLLGLSSAVGDINGDGIKDIILGAPGFYDTDGHGAVYVIFGSTSQPANLNLSTANYSSNGTKGFRVDFESNFDSLGSSVSSGDVNGDGIDDLIMGAPNANSNGGISYVLFGKSTAWTSPIDLSVAANTNGTNGFKITGSGTEKSGTSVATGDINADGIADVIIGAPAATGAAATSGRTYIVFGNTGAWSAVTLSALVGTSATVNINGLYLSGAAAGNRSGTSVSSADMNGDGIADIVVGAPNTTVGGANAGSIYVVYGQTATQLASWPAFYNLSALTTGVAPKGFRLDGSTGDYAGTVVAGGCSLRGDGLENVIIGAPQTTANKGVSYAAFAIPNGGTAWSNTNTLSSMDGKNGLKIIGLANADKFGTSVAAGDFSGAGKCTYAIGAPGVSSNAGAVYVVYGMSIWPSTFNLTTLR
jgi:hypothetical protein